MQNADIAEKVSKTSYLLKEYILSNGNVIYLQGYEPFALDILLQEYEESDIITSKQEVPEIWWNFKDDSTKHRHYVDIYIPSINKCIEVKSTWTYNKEEEKVLAKQLAAKTLGFDYEIWIFDKHHKIINKIV